MADKSKSKSENEKGKDIQKARFLRMLIELVGDPVVMFLLYVDSVSEAYKELAVLFHKVLSERERNTLYLVYGIGENLEPMMQSEVARSEEVSESSISLRIKNARSKLEGSFMPFMPKTREEKVVYNEPVNT
jgi:hypothetical protein